MRHRLLAKAAVAGMGAAGLLASLGVGAAAATTPYDGNVSGTGDKAGNTGQGDQVLGEQQVRSTGLALTGADIAGLAAGGVILIGGGTILVQFGRRRTVAA